MKIIPLFLKIIALAALLSACVRGIESPAPAASPGPTVVTLTFDEGYADNFVARDMLAERGMRATFYIVATQIGTPDYMTWDQIQALYADGNDIGGHTLSHPDLRELTRAEMDREICGDRAILMEKGLNPVSFAYPGGHWTDEAKQAVRECGYNSARLVVGGPELLPPPDPYGLETMPYIFNDTDLSKIKRYVTGVQNDGGGWAILVFHYVCDNCHQYSITPSNLEALLDWLKSKADDMISVQSVAEALGGTVKPAP